MPSGANADGDVVDLIISVPNVLLFGAVAVVSFRRSRLLSRHPFWRSLATAVLAGMFWVIWVIVSLVNRDQVSQE